MKQINLHIGDVAVALALGLLPRSPLKSIAEATARSLGEVHGALVRLRGARLLEPKERQACREPLLSFIRWGVPHAFPPSIGAFARGIATARLSADQTEPPEAEFVWPDPSGATRGQAFAPPYPRAARLLTANPPLRRLLSLLDLVRIGGAREQEAAVNEIGRILLVRPPD